MNESEIIIRKAIKEDIANIISLFESTVRAINSKDYTSTEIEIWANSSKNENRWFKNITEQSFYIAEIKNSIVGFGSITKNGYLDFMYIHKDFQRQGIAKKLLLEIEKKAVTQNNNEIYSNVSKTAKPFFKKFGYIYSGDQINSVKGIEFVNSIMKKELT